MVGRSLLHLTDDEWTEHCRVLADEAEAKHGSTPPDCYTCGRACNYRNEQNLNGWQAKCARCTYLENAKRVALKYDARVREWDEGGRDGPAPQQNWAVIGTRLANDPRTHQSNAERKKEAKELAAPQPFHSGNDFGSDSSDNDELEADKDAHGNKYATSKRRRIGPEPQSHLYPLRPHPPLRLERPRATSLISERPNRGSKITLSKASFIKDYYVNPSAPDTSIPIPRFVPNSAQPFPNNVLVERSYAKIATAHYINDASLGWHDPKPAKCHRCGIDCDWLRGDYVLPWVREATGTLEIRYQVPYKGVLCRPCHRVIQIPDQLDAEQKRVAKQLLKVEGVLGDDRTLKHGLYRVAYSTLQRLELREKQVNIPLDERFTRHWVRPEHAASAIAAFLLRLASCGKALPGIDITTSSMNWHDTKRADKLLDDFEANAECWHCHRKLTLQPEKKYQFDLLSLDRLNSELNYYDDGQFLVISCVGCNFMYGDAGPEARCELNSVIFTIPYYVPVADASLEEQLAHVDARAHGTSPTHAPLGDSRFAPGIERMQEIEDSISGIIQRQKHRRHHEKRAWEEGILNSDETLVDRCGWAGLEASPEAQKKVLLPWYLASRGLCAISGVPGAPDDGSDETTAGLRRLHIDRVFNGGIYEEGNTVLMLGAFNLFKATLPYLDSHYEFRIFLETQPHLAKVYVDKGPIPAVVAYVRSALLDRRDADGKWLVVEATRPALLTHQYTPPNTRSRN